MTPTPPDHSAADERGAATRHFRALKPRELTLATPKRGHTENLVGAVFDRWTVESFAGYFYPLKGRYTAYWYCVCTCGHRRRVDGRMLRTGGSKSCGCLPHDMLLARMRNGGSTAHGKSLAKYYYEIRAAQEINPTLAETLWRDVLCRDRKDCWLWTGAKNNKGYGVISLHIGSVTRLPVRVFARFAHRLSWILANDADRVPDGMEVIHRCDTPACVNPAHLALGTHAENMADMARKGRARCQPNAPLTYTKRPMTPSQAVVL